MSKSKKQTADVVQISNLDLRSIRPNDHNPRKSFPEASMNELIESVQEKGILQPIIVRPWENVFQIVAGERRWRAAAAVAEKTKGPYSIPAIVRNLNDTEVKEIQIIENIQRAEMHPMEEAEAFFELEVTGNKPEEISAKVGKSVYYVRQRLKLNSLHERWVEVYKGNFLKNKTAIQLANLPLAIQEDIFNNKYSEGNIFILNEYLLRQYECDLNSANFKLNGSYAELPQCTNCQFNSACNSLFPEDEQTAHCSHKKCYDAKVKLAFEHDIAEAKEDPGTVFITTGGVDTILKTWQDEGLEVYNHSNFKEIEAPDPDDYNMNANEDEDDDEVEGNVETYQEEEKARYEQDLAEYNEKLQDPTLVKAIIMDGYHQGDTILGFLDNESAPVNASEDVTPEDPNQAINDEINRIKVREIRSKQLDNEKVWAKMTEIIEPKENKKILFNLEPLSQEELNAAARCIEHKIGWDKQSWVSDFNKWWGCGKNVTEENIRGLLRILICSTLGHIGQPHTNKGSDAHVFYPILKAYFPDNINTIEAEQQEITDKRTEKVNQKLKALKKKLVSPRE